MEQGIINAVQSPATHARAKEAGELGEPFRPLSTLDHIISQSTGSIQHFRNSDHEAANNESRLSR